MSAMDNAIRFFHACETLGGFEGCQQWMNRKATFEGQCEPLIGIDTVQAYVNWLKAVGSGPLKGCSYELHSAGYDETRRVASFFATFIATHTGDGGPVPPTGKSTRSHYAYLLTLGDDDRVTHMVKIWNAPWALRELGWL